MNNIYTLLCLYDDNDLESQYMVLKICWVI